MRKMKLVLIITVLLLLLSSCWKKTIDNCETVECVNTFKAKIEAKKELEQVKNELKKEIWDKTEIKEEKSNFKITSFSCDKTLKECSSENKNTTINNILQINELVCDLKEVISPDNYKDIFVNFDNRTDIISNINLTDWESWIKTLNFTIEKDNIKKDKKGKEINIMFDLTYFGKKWSDIEKDVLNSREKALREIISNWVWNIQIEYWDKINLFYIWTSDYWESSKWHKNYAITDNNSFILKNHWSNLSGIYNITYICEKNNRKKKLKMYFYTKGKKEINIKTKKINDLYVSNIKMLEEELLKVVNTKYNSGKFNKWTYLIESLDKNEKFINGSWSINILISDMFFQLHPDMKKTHKITWAERDFTKDFIWKLKNYIDYTAFYYNIIPKYIENKCNNNEELYIIGTNLSDDLDVKKKMKEYYKNIFFKWCNVHFN